MSSKKKQGTLEGRIRKYSKLPAAKVSGKTRRKRKIVEPKVTENNRAYFEEKARNLACSRG